MNYEKGCFDNRCFDDAFGMWRRATTAVRRRRSRRRADGDDGTALKLQPDGNHRRGCRQYGARERRQRGDGRRHSVRRMPAHRH